MPESATILFGCPHCQRRLKVGAKAAGRNFACPDCAKQVVVPAWTLGEGRYEVKRKLGEGGMAFALLALDTTLGADVVLKVPKPIILADPEFARRFRREIHSMQELTHDHIVKIKDVGEDDGMPFYVMELLAGGSLQDRFEPVADNKSKPMPPGSLADWLLPVADALDFIHQRFVHRDIKPANILFDTDGKAFVSDFGIVKAIADGAGQAKQTVMTQAGIVIGTAAYMAPELADGKKVDGRVDQYALAVTVYQALSGRLPFEGTTFIEILEKRLTGKIAPLHDLAPALPKALTQVVEKGMSLDPKDRYASCSVFAKAVLGAAKTARETTKANARPNAVCPACRKPFALPPDPAGKGVTCPACGAGFTVAKRASEKTVAETGQTSAPDTRTRGAEPKETAPSPANVKTVIEPVPAVRPAPAYRAPWLLLLSVGAFLMLVACAGAGVIGWQLFASARKDIAPDKKEIAAKTPEQKSGEKKKSDDISEPFEEEFAAALKRAEVPRGWVFTEKIGVQPDATGRACIQVIAKQGEHFAEAHAPGLMDGDFTIEGEYRLSQGGYGVIMKINIENRKSSAPLLVTFRQTVGGGGVVSIASNAERPAPNFKYNETNRFRISRKQKAAQVFVNDGPDAIVYAPVDEGNKYDTIRVGLTAESGWLYKLKIGPPPP